MHSRSSFLLTFFITQLLSESYDGWIQPPSKLPRSSNRMAVGYDYYTDTIRLLGGEFTRKKQLLSFKDNTFIDHGEYNLSHNIYGSSQYFRQIDNNLWMIDESGNHFNKFNLHTLQLEYNYNSITIPSNVQGSSCLTSISIQNNDNYLIVVGGSIPGSVPLSLVQIFNMTGNVWLSNVPNMQQPRMQHACSTHGDLLYAIGGIISHPVRTNSIEILNISELHDIQSEQWSFIDNLLEPMNNNFALVYKNDIIVIGGDTVQGNHVDQINVIDTLTNTVTAGGYLSHQIDTISSILIFPYIYIFGGTDNAQVFDTWQYHILPSKSPSQIPTNIPSNYPTYITNNPSVYPTSNEPTSSPVIGNCLDNGLIKNLYWKNISNSLPEYEFNINVDEIDLGINIEFITDYLGNSYDINNNPIGTSYIFDFIQFHSYNDRIENPGSCSNRLLSSYNIG
eukprot:399423_1